MAGARLRFWITASAVVLIANGGRAEAPAEPAQATWGTIDRAAEQLGQWQLTIDKRPATGKLDFARPFPNVSLAWFGGAGASRQSLPFTLSADAAELQIELPAAKDMKVVQLETVEQSQQFADGRIALSALDAKVFAHDGSTPAGKLETQPGNHRIGFWTDSHDAVRWEYTATRPGMYDVLLTYSSYGGDGTEIETVVGEKSLTAKLKQTGSWYRYETLSLGNVYIPAPGKLNIAIRCLKQTGPAVMNLKAVTLRPTSEGTPPKQADDGSIVCHARDATLDSVLLQYEPKPEKNTLGYWVNERDAAHWDFVVTKPGRYEVEILQGCGKGQGGSDVQFSIAGQELNVTVEDTGHFQNFVPRVIGEVELEKGAGQRLTVKALRKQAGAIMDLRQVRLSPK